MTSRTFLWYSPSNIMLSVTWVDFISNGLFYIQFLPNLTTFISPMSSLLFLWSLYFMLNKSSSRSGLLQCPIGAWRNRLLSSVIGPIFLSPPSLTVLMPHLLLPLPSDITLWCKLDLLWTRKFCCAYRYEITFWTTEGRVTRDLVAKNICCDFPVATSNKYLCFLCHSVWLFQGLVCKMETAVVVWST